VWPTKGSLAPFPRPERAVPSLAGLRGLSVNADGRQQIVLLGALEPLILAASADSIEVQRKVGATLSDATAIPVS